jgi:hypothetical protein
MTVTGVALIAGGIATLIGCRKLLWAGRGQARVRGRRAARRRAIEAARRPQLTAAPAAVRPDRRDDERGGSPATPPEQDDNSAALAELEPELPDHPAARRAAMRDAAPDDEPSGLAAIGLADAEDPEEDLDVADVAEEQPAEPVHRRLARAVLARADRARQSERFDLACVADAARETGGDGTERAEPEPREWWRDERGGERVPHESRDERGGAPQPREWRRGDGGEPQPREWWRGDGGEPQPREWWRDERGGEPEPRGWWGPDRAAPEVPTGDYWTPIPESGYADLDAPDDGGTVRAAVPSGRAWAGESEPTAVVPVWPPAHPADRIELPRTWSGSENRRRPRPRPNQVAESRSSVYVSKHAAEPG